MNDFFSGGFGKGFSGFGNFGFADAEDIFKQFFSGRDPFKEFFDDEDLFNIRGRRADPKHSKASNHQNQNQKTKKDRFSKFFSMGFEDSDFSFDDSDDSSDDDFSTFFDRSPQNPSGGYTKAFKRSSTFGGCGAAGVSKSIQTVSETRNGKTIKRTVTTIKHADGRVERKEEVFESSSSNAGVKKSLKH